MKPIPVRLFAATAALFLVGSAFSSLNAQVVTYLNRAEFDLATTMTQPISTFEGLTTGVLQPSYTVDGILYTSFGPNVQLEFGSGANFGTTANNTALLVFGTTGSLGTAGVDITPPAGTTAFGFDIKDSFNTTIGVNLGSYAIYVNGTLLVTQASPQQQFFNFVGFTSDTPITSVSVRTLAGGDPLLDNVTVGTSNVPAIPEPGTNALLAIGGIAAGLIYVRRSRRQAAASEAKP